MAPGRGAALRLIILYKVECISLIEEEGPQHFVHLRMSPVLTEDIRWVDVAGNVVECHKPGGDSLAHVMAGQRVMALG